MERESAGDAKEILEKWFKFNGKPAKFKEGMITVDDKFNGDIPVFWKGNYLVGIFSEKGSVMPGAATLLRDIAGKL